MMLLVGETVIYFLPNMNMPSVTVVGNGFDTVELDSLTFLEHIPIFTLKKMVIIINYKE